MSATGRSDVRVESDFYATPAWCVYRLLEAVDLPHGEWLDPCAGDGAILRAGPSSFDVTWTAVEIRPECEQSIRNAGASKIVIGDFLELAKRTTKRWDVVLTNPPYSLALPFVQTSIARADIVVMLLRLNWLASEKRASWMREHTPDVYVLPNRPVFRGSHGDATEYGWFVWGMSLSRGNGQIRILNSTPKSERERTGDVNGATQSR